MTARLLASAWTLVILVACLLPAEGLPDLEFVPLSADKWIHLLLFIGFGLTWATAIPHRVGWVLGAGVALAIATEVGQWALPINRSGDPFDALADVLGLLAGVAIGRWIVTRSRGS